MTFLSGSVVLGLVLVIGVIALVLAGTSSKQNQHSRTRGQRGPAGLVEKETPASRPRATALTHRSDADESLRESSLLVPPPDEKRIEAVPPKNEPFRRK